MHAAFPLEAGYTIEYGTWPGRDQADASGWRQIPIAVVTAPDGQERAVARPRGRLAGTESATAE